ncbi:hypothetical protein LTR62_007285 [Meristemomyces frigidus]|uniref:DUF4396 domain-containing protein n=1 Tax=Meristemomyces frigidus TaxID=1508187 RepID=A0AAN7TBQ0_9PEZI|nr:hypothetical protein LTR62_007285 [Meristemomyces frigidus]
MDQMEQYHEPLALIIISSISIGIAAIVAGWILLDIILRRGWRSMMLIMIPVYVINALYLWPLTLWTYLLYGRSQKVSKGEAAPSCHNTNTASGADTSKKGDVETGGDPETPAALACHDPTKDHQTTTAMEGHETMHGNHMDHDQHQHHHHGGERPMFATVTIAVCHCGAGCVIGDIIGEWLVYATGASINGQSLWVNFLVDFAFAIAFGIVFQYFSIAPMSGDYGVKTLIRAAKADFFSLVFFEVGLFSWMAIFQIAIFHWQLPITTVTYWWMMQIGMFLGHWTGIPINWWLIKTGVKEPCA